MKCKNCGDEAGQGLTPITMDLSINSNSMGSTDITANFCCFGCMRTWFDAHMDDIEIAEHTRRSKVGYKFRKEA